MVQWSKFAECEAFGKIQTHNPDSKICSSDIKIVKELSFLKVLEILKSDGISMSDGISRSNGISGSKFLNDCNGLSDSLFCDGLKNQYYIFNKKVPKERYETILNKLNELLNGWTPQFNNAEELYLKSGSEWEKTPINLIKENDNPYAGMPEEAIKYIKSLKEFNEKIFKKICEL